jgi:tetratricopeptide (TPR) repeat protein
MAVITFNPSRALRLQKAAFLPALAFAAMFGLAGCETSNTSDAVIRIDKAQGSQENIASLTAVINANPRDPEGYNVRGSAYGRAGEFRQALNDFNTALQINPRFFQAYANRALVYRNMGQQQQAIADYNAALQINPSYDVAYIGRGNV